jgi:hypothetical protein
MFAVQIGIWFFWLSYLVFHTIIWFFLLSCLVFFTNIVSLSFVDKFVYCDLLKFIPKAKGDDTAWLMQTFTYCVGSKNGSRPTWRILHRCLTLQLIDIKPTCARHRGGSAETLVVAMWNREFPWATVQRNGRLGYEQLMLLAAIGVSGSKQSKYFQLNNVSFLIR